MLPDESSINVSPDQEPWAPDVHFLNDQYCVYAVTTMGSQALEIGVAKSPSLSPGGVWTDHARLGIPKSALYNLIDPNLFREGIQAISSSARTGATSSRPRVRTITSAGLVRLR
jgi:arabinan endo-1,5-alpha-L-arabinosidase